MSRVINLDSPGKLRSQLMRTSAEVLRRLGEKSSFDDETRDLVALLIYAFREIDEGIDVSVRAWEKRDYWVKAEQFRLRWSWVRDAEHRLTHIIREDEWERLPMTLVELLPYFSDIKVAKYTRKPSLWNGAYRRLQREHSAGSKQRDS